MPGDSERELRRAGRTRRRDDWEDEDDRPRPRRRRSRSRAGLWVGLGIGGVALVGLVVVLIVVLSGSSKSGPGETQKKLVGKWERVGGNPTASMHSLEFSDTGIFRLGHHDTVQKRDWLMEFGSYKVSGSKATIRISQTSTLSINGNRIQELDAELLSDDELQLKYLSSVEKYRKVK